MHELAHSASEFDTVHAVYMDVDPGNLLLQRPSIFMPRVGYDVDTVATIDGKLEYLPTRGTFFEEAYASDVAGLYGWEHEDRKLFKDEGTFSNRYKLWVHADQVIYEPKTLLNKMIDNRQAFSFVPSMATSAMRNFIALDPSIEEDFMNSRHSMLAIQNTYAKLDRLKPGLAKRLYNLPYSPDGFSKGLRLSYQVAAEHGVEVVPAKYRNLVQRWSPLKPVDESLPVPALVPGANVFEL